MNAPIKTIDMTPHKMTVDMLIILAESGVFDGGGKVELLDGALYEMSPQSTQHFKVRNRLTFRLQSALIDLKLPYEAFSDATVALDDNFAPEPDIIICSDLKDSGFAPVAAVKLAVEVSVTSQKGDLGYKKSLYAQAGIPEYWVVDVEAKRIHIFWSPEGEDYRGNSVIEIGAELVSQTILGLAVETSGIL